MTPTIDAARRRVRLEPRDPGFFNNPYRAYAAIHAASPVLFWEDYGFWCFSRHADAAIVSCTKRSLVSAGSDSTNG